MRARVLWLHALFVASLVVAAMLAAKIVQLGPFVVPAGVFPFAFTFLCTDILTEVYGAPAARRLALAGLLALVACIGWIQLAIWLPPAPFWPHQQPFATLFQSGLRIAAASIAAYALSQWTDIWLFARLRRLCGPRMLWLRNTASTAASQLLDTAVFITLAFGGGTLPLGELILGQWAVKLSLAVLDTPLAYLGVWWLRQEAAPPAARAA